MTPGVKIEPPHPGLGYCTVQRSGPDCQGNGQGSHHDSGMPWGHQ